MLIVCVPSNSPQSSALPVTLFTLVFVRPLSNLTCQTRKKWHKLDKSIFFDSFFPPNFFFFIERLWEKGQGADAGGGLNLPLRRPAPGQQWTEVTLLSYKWLNRVAGGRHHLGPCPHQPRQASMRSLGMLIRGLGLSGNVRSRARHRKRKACRKHEVHAGFTRTNSHKRGQPDKHHEDHTLAATAMVLF